MGNLKFSYIRRLGLFSGFIFFISIFLGLFKKNEYFWGTDILWIFFWDRCKSGLFRGLHFRAFS